MSKKHGNYYDGKRWCKECSKLIGPKGWSRHQQFHSPEGAPYLGGGGYHRKKTSNGASMELIPVEKPYDFSILGEEPPVNSEIVKFSVSTEALMTAQSFFPTDPLLWNAFMLMTADEQTPENLRSAAHFINYKADLMTVFSN